MRRPSGAARATSGGGTARAALQPSRAALLPLALRGFAATCTNDLAAMRSTAAARLGLTLLALCAGLAAGASGPGFDYLMLSR